MTDLQKKQIVAMRNKKATYASISETLGIPVNTIKTFCRRNGMVTETFTRKLCCKNCGQEITSTPNATGASRPGGTGIVMSVPV